MPQNKGDKAYLPEGGTATFDGTNWIQDEPSIAQDVKEGALPALYKGMLGLKTTPAGLASGALNLGGWLTSKIPGEVAAKISGLAEKGKEALDPYTYGAQLEKTMEKYPEMGYEMATRPGKFLGTGLEWAPGVALAAATGNPTSIVTRGAGGRFARSVANRGLNTPAIVKGAAGAVGSEAAGETAHELGVSPEWETTARLLGGGLPVAGPPMARGAANLDTGTLTALGTVAGTLWGGLHGGLQGAENMGILGAVGIPTLKELQKKLLGTVAGKPGPYTSLDPARTSAILAAPTTINEASYPTP